MRATGSAAGAVRKTNAIIRKLMEYVSNAEASGLWTALSDRLMRIKKAMYSARGGLYGRVKWPMLSDSGAKRRGSRGGYFGVYSSDKLPLFASGAYSDSFGVLAKTPRTMRWGSSHELADRIPYGGWQTGQSPRYVLPDTLSADWIAEVSDANRLWLAKGVDLAIKESGQ